jgi:uracil-DNA glycosylase
VIVGLAPAAHGGNRTGRMFTGDRSGDWLFESLHRFGFASQAESRDRNDGLELRDCIIIAAVRCAPPANKPSPEEMHTCRAFLRSELEMLDRKRVVLALGQIAFNAFLEARRESGLPQPAIPMKFKHAGEWHFNDEFTLISSYHPSQQNTLTGRLTRPMFHSVFQRARDIIDRGDKI